MSQLSSPAEIANSVLTRRVGLAGFVVLFWDHALTFHYEVEYIWKDCAKKRNQPFIWLFFLNRYFIPLGFVVNIIAYFSDFWTNYSCNHFVVYEGCMTMLGIAISGLMMMLRVEALYRHRIYHKPILGTLIVLWLGFVGTYSYLLTHAEAVKVAGPHIISCTMIFNPNEVQAVAASASAWIPLLYDTTVLVLTLIRTLPDGFRRPTSVMMHELAREGVLYYSVIFSITLVLAVMIVVADPSVKNIAAQLELCFTAAMMSRITLDLKMFARTPRTLETSQCYDGRQLAWRAVMRPPRSLVFVRDRVQHVERAAGDSNVFTVASHASRDGTCTRPVNVNAARDWHDPYDDWLHAHEVFDVDDHRKDVEDQY